jgi:Kef-type K+ transport system membrane component KefB
LIRTGQPQVVGEMIAGVNLGPTSLSTLSLTAGAFDDAMSWCVLAVVLATFGAGPGIAVLAIGGAVSYAAFIMLIGGRLLAPFGQMVEGEGGMSMTVLSITLALFWLSAFIIDAVGIHAIFGEFIVGVVMPRGLFAEELKKKVEPIAVVLLLPMFFTYSGLNTRMDMVNTAPLLLIALGILVASIVAKFGACCGAGRGIYRAAGHSSGASGDHQRMLPAVSRGNCLCSADRGCICREPRPWHRRDRRQNDRHAASEASATGAGEHKVRG